MRPQKKHPEHPCIECLRPTTNKNYCDLHLKIYMKPAFTPFRGGYITADVDYSGKRITRRNETSGVL